MTKWNKDDAAVVVTVTFAGGPRGGAKGTHELQFTAGIAKRDWTAGRVDFDRLRVQAARFWVEKHQPSFNYARDLAVILCKRVAAGPKPKVPKIVEITVSCDGVSFAMTTHSEKAWRMAKAESNRPKPSAALLAELTKAGLPPKLHQQVKAALAQREAGK